MSLRDSTELIDGIPTWIECTIYRNDRILPIVIKEYLEEVRTDHSSWQQMPRRMLRHRVIQQCARLAFNISNYERLSENSSRKINLSHNEPKRSGMSILKENLHSKQAAKSNYF